MQENQNRLDLVRWETEAGGVQREKQEPDGAEEGSENEKSRQGLSTRAVAAQIGRRCNSHSRRRRIGRSQNTRAAARLGRKHSKNRRRKWDEDTQRKWRRAVGKGKNRTARGFFGRDGTDGGAAERRSQEENGDENPNHSGGGARLGRREENSGSSNPSVLTKRDRAGGALRDELLGKPKP
jgi:hypothetical protein